MLASHNSYTFLPPRRWWHRLTAPLWRCQTRDINAQLRAGARLLDIRVRRDAAGGGWRPCHGLVDLGRCCYPYLGALLPRDTPCRIILERGGPCDMIRFADAVSELIELGFPVSVAAIKRGWRVVHRDAAVDGRCVDHYFKPFDSACNLWTNLRNLLRNPSTIALTAQAQNARRPDWAADPDHYHLIDLL